MDGGVPPPNFIGMAPAFTGREPSRIKQWSWGCETRHRNQVNFLLEGMARLRDQGLVGAKLVHVFIRRWIQPCRLRRNGLWAYSGQGDPDRNSPDALTHEDIRTYVGAITEGASSSSSWSADPTALSASLLSYLVSRPCFL